MSQAAAIPEDPAYTAGRLTDSGPSANLERLALSGEIERGCATVIGLDAIRDRLGAKWSLRRDWVWETTERHLQKRLGDTGFCVRLGEVDFAICAGGSPEASRAISLNLLRELLDFFLGSSRLEDMRLASVIWVRGEEIGCAPLDPRKVQPLDESRSFQPVAAAPARRAASPAWSVLSFSTGEGRQLDVDLAFEPVINLRNRVPVATRLKPVVHDHATGELYVGRWIEQLAPADQTAVIAALGDAALARYAEGEVGLVIPCSLYAISATRSRAVVVEKLQALAARPTKPVVMELIDVDQGTPQGRLLEGVSLLSPHSRAVIVRVGVLRPDPEILRGARLGGVSADCAGCDVRELYTRVKAISHLGPPIGPLTFAFGLGSRAACEIALAAGASHGGLSPSRPETVTILQVAH